jgi:uncharacterized membrane protein YhaH (DUF805 family)
MPLGQLFFGFHGRIGRLLFWGASLLVCAVSISLWFVIHVWFPSEPNGRPDPAVIALLAILQLPLCWANLAIQVKRWHDRNLSGWWVFINLVPFVGWIWALVENGFLAGNIAANRFGPSPQDIRASADIRAMTASPRSEEIEQPPALSGGPLLALVACAALAGAALFLGFEHLASSDPEPTGAQAPRTIAPTTSFDVPALRGRVNDYADLLTPEQESELAGLYRSLEQEIGCQIALLTIDNLNGVSIEDYSLEVANTWALGRRGIDDGVLITLARQDRRVRLAVGPGLESIVPDDAAGTIIQQMVPSFANGDFFKGLKDGSLEIVRMIHAKPDLVGHRESTPHS